MLRFLLAPLTVFKSMSRREHLLYWALPLLAGWFATAMYFSGISWMQELIAPAYNREFGLLENIDALLIACTLAVLIRMSLLPMRPLFKATAVLACLVTALLFLEEIDYGLHVIDWMKGIPPSAEAEIRNLHNQGDNTDNIKAVANLILATLFVVLPYIDSLKRYRLVKMLCPSKMICFTVIATALVALLHQALDPYNLPSNRALDSNQSEFEEMLIYYTFLVYFREKYTQFKTTPEYLNPK
jgi:hypothetical protein